MRPALAAGVMWVGLAAALPAQIADNSFFVEEAYNQEARVVQHIAVALRARDGHWSLGFTQEWPLFSAAHQLSGTVPAAVDPDGHWRLDDALLNYRYQLIGGDGAVAIAPRLSLLFPTGDAAAGVGRGGLGVQLNLPVSARVGHAFALHANAGWTLVPDASDAMGNRATHRAANLAASVIWLARPRVNLLLETAWLRGREVAGPGATAPVEALYVVPGVRWAHDFASGAQLVPGLGYAFGAGPTRGDGAVVLYLSVEHGF